MCGFQYISYSHFPVEEICVRHRLGFPAIEIRSDIGCLAKEVFNHPQHFPRIDLVFKTQMLAATKDIISKTLGLIPLL